MPIKEKMTAEKKIKEIAKVLMDYNVNDIHQYGLLAGGAGIALFLNEYAKHTQSEEVRQATMKVIDRMTDLVFETDPYPTHCAGLSGVAHFLVDMEEEGLVGSMITKDIDTYLELSFKTEVYRNQYDFLHGAIGIAYYFVAKADKKKKYQRNVKQLLTYLDKSAIRFEENGQKMAKWVSFEYKTGDPTFNISLSHGMSSILAILLQVHQVGFDINRNKTTDLIERCTNYILNQQIDCNIYESYFPYVSIESTKEMHGSRLAWCYGDLGIAIVLWQAGKVLNRQDWMDKAVEVLLFNADRRDYSTNGVMDSCICHGTAGIAHIYNRMYRNTQNPKFKETCDFWIQETLKMAHYPDGLAGYKTFHGMEGEVQWINDYFLLEGIAGVGLALLSSITDLDPKWDKYFLLS